MKIYTDVTIKRTKDKILAKIPIEEFMKGDWLDLVPASKYSEVNYNARTEELHISNLNSQTVIDHLQEKKHERD